MPHDVLPLESLATIPALPRGSHIALLQKCCVCFDNQQFSSGLSLLAECQGFPNVGQEGQAFFRVTWDEGVDEVLRGAHADLKESVEDSAKAIGMLLIRRLTPYTTARQAPRGTSVDYFLVNPDEELPFQAQTTACAEFTGILNGEDKIPRRMQEKRDRLSKQKRDFPTYIVCVEHSYPVAQIERVEP